MTPLPISDHFFKHKPAVTNMDQVKIAYIGRFSADKGVANLLNWWSHNAHSMGACRLSLLLVGELSHDQKYSLVTKKWRKDQHKLLLKHIKRTPRNVRILPSQTTQQLAKLLSKIDYLISFSTFPLEEFGMALAAGAASGTGLLISRWAGHENFNSAPHRHFLPIAGGASPFVNTRNLSTLLCKLKPLSKSQRQQQILWAKKVVSQKHVSKIIRSNFATKIKVPAISTNDKKLRLDKKRWIELCKNIIAQD
jgi:glycosyltransferase involved in cell wall biosynthesis